MGKFEVQNVDSVKMYKIRKTLEELTQQSGRGTELITVYIPKGQQLHEVMTQLREEQGTADNICLLYTSPSPRDRTRSRMPSSA